MACEIGADCFDHAAYDCVVIKSFVPIVRVFTIHQFFESEPGAGLGAYQRLFCGGIAGVTSVTFTYPLDIVRTRLSIQSASFKNLSEISHQQKMGMFRTLVVMYHNEGGIRALYRGIIPTIAGVAPYVRSNPEYDIPF